MIINFARVFPKSWKTWILNTFRFRVISVRRQRVWDPSFTSYFKSMKTTMGYNNLKEWVLIKQIQDSCYDMNPTQMESQYCRPLKFLNQGRSVCGVFKIFPMHNHQHHFHFLLIWLMTEIYLCTLSSTEAMPSINLSYSVVCTWPMIRLANKVYGIFCKVHYLPFDNGTKVISL